MPQTRTVVETREATPSPDGSGRMLIQLISPGVGSSGYYSPEVLESAAERRVFPAGTQIYLDHPSETEEWDRPERSVRDLAGVLNEDARWTGEALVGEARIFSPARQVLSEMADADAIGMSIRSTAVISEGEHEGRRMPIVDELVEGLSVDFVTRAGRGGRVLQVIESARRTAAREVAGFTASDVRDALSRAGRDAYGAEGVWVWLRDYSDEWAVFEVEAEDSQRLLRQAFTVQDGVITLSGEPVEVTARTEYVPVPASQASEADTGQPDGGAPAEPTGDQPADNSAGDDAPQDPPNDAPDNAPDEAPADTPDAGDPPGTDPAPTEENRMPQLTDAEVRDLTEARDRANTTLAEAERQRDEARAEVSRLRARESARPVIAARVNTVVAAEFADVIRDRVTENLLADLPLTDDGSLDEPRLTIRADAVAAREADQLARSLEALGAGKVAGLGATSSAPEISEADLDKASAAAFGRTVKEN